jgi:hypothetical protein
MATEDTITLTQESVQDAVTFLEQYLVDKLPGYDFGPGTSNRDIAVNSIALTVAFLRQEILDVRNRQSLKTLSELPEDESLDDAVDEILSNWFINRKIGKRSRGVATLFFTTNEIGTIYVTSSDVINKDSSTAFSLKDGEVFITKEDLTRNVSNTGTVYYTYAITVECTTEGDNDLEPGTFESWTIASPYLYRVENFSKFVGGEGVETTEELLQRSETAITVRDLNTARSITTVMREEFSQVEDVTVVGYGDAEFQRDLLEVNLGFSGTVNIHRGSMMDIWTKLPLDFGKTLTVTPTAGVLNGANVTYFTLPAEPILRINSLQDESVNPAEDVSYTIEVEDTTLYLSDRQVVYVVVPSSYANKVLELNYDGVIGYEELQTYVEDDHNRILVADPLVKSLHPMYLKFDLRYSGTSLVLDTEAAKKTIQSFVHNYPITDELSVSELACSLSNNYADYVHRIEFPVVVVGELHLSTGEIITTNYTDRLEVPEKYARLSSGGVQGIYGTEVAPAGSSLVLSTDVQLSNRTTRYILPLENITITEI